MKHEDHFKTTILCLAKQMRKVLIFLLILLPLTFHMQPTFAKGMKGNLEGDELNFIYHTFIPILIKYKICVNAGGDCKHQYIICTSLDSLACNVYGIADETVIKEILLAALNSGLNISEFAFWKNKYHATSLFEKPLLEFTNRMGTK